MYFKDTVYGEADLFPPLIISGFVSKNKCLFTSIGINLAGCFKAPSTFPQLLNTSIMLQRSHSHSQPLQWAWYHNTAF